FTLLNAGELDDISGNAQAAADSIHETIGGTIAQIQTEFGDLATAFFSSDQIDIQGKLDDIKTAIHTFIDQINSGNTVGGSLEIALGTPGLEHAIEQFESVMGNVGIVLMQAVSGLMAAT